jgi:hypothetical protein
VVPGSPAQLIVAVSIMQAFTLLTVRMAPYVHKTDDWASFASSFALVLTSFGGLILIMDKGGDEAYFNGDAIGTALIVLNSTVFVMQIICILLIRLNFCKRLSSKVLGQTKIRPKTGSVKDEKTKKSQEASAVSILPSLAGGSVVAGASDDGSSTSVEVVEALQRSFSQSEERLGKSISFAQEKSKRNTQMRLIARNRLKNSRRMLRISAFSKLSEEEVGLIIDQMQLQSGVVKGTVILKQNDPSDAFYVVTKGSLSVLAQIPGKPACRVGTIRDLEFFGEGMFAGQVLASATVTVESATATVLKLTRKKFERLFIRGSVGHGVLESVKSLFEERVRSNDALMRREGGGGGGAGAGAGAAGPRLPPGPLSGPRLVPGT